MCGKQASTTACFYRARKPSSRFSDPTSTPASSGSFEATRGTESSLDSSLSTVVDQQLITNLPLNGRDVYALLALQPGVTADSTTVAGLGFAVVRTKDIGIEFPAGRTGKQQLIW